MRELLKYRNKEDAWGGPEMTAEPRLEGGRQLANVSI